MSEIKYRIPRMAMAVMVLGGAGCGDDSSSGGGSAGVDTSDSRVRSIATTSCNQEKTCDVAEFNDSYSSAQQCIDTFYSDMKTGLTKVSKACGDAYLDYADCESHLGCKQVTSSTDSSCKAAYEAYEAACRGMSPDF